MKIDGRRVILTGAASGIGRATLLRLARYDAQIIAVDLDATRLTEAVVAASGERAQVVPFATDLGAQAGVDALFEFALTHMGGIDIFIANAGFAYYERIERADWSHIEAIFRVNVFSPLYALERMAEVHPTDEYLVVMTASAQAYLGLAGYALYGATKAALDRFAEAYRYELRPNGRLTLIYPISTRTNFFQAASPDEPPMQPPSQDADDVARALVHGIERDKAIVYPSRVFRVVYALRGITPLWRSPQRIAALLFRRWLRR